MLKRLIEDEFQLLSRWKVATKAETRLDSLKKEMANVAKEMTQMILDSHRSAILNILNTEISQQKKLQLEEQRINSLNKNVSKSLERSIMSINNIEFQGVMAMPSHKKGYSTWTDVQDLQ
jgi:hypothetical protein